MPQNILPSANSEYLWDHPLLYNNHLSHEKRVGPEQAYSDAAAKEKNPMKKSVGSSPFTSSPVSYNCPECPELQPTPLMPASPMSQGLCKEQHWLDCCRPQTNADSWKFSGSGYDVWEATSFLPMGTRSCNRKNSQSWGTEVSHSMVCSFHYKNWVVRNCAGQGTLY